MPDDQRFDRRRRRRKTKTGVTSDNDIGYRAERGGRGSRPAWRSAAPHDQSKTMEDGHLATGQANGVSNDQAFAGKDDSAVTLEMDSIQWDDDRQRLPPLPRAPTVSEPKAVGSHSSGGEGERIGKAHNSASKPAHQVVNGN